MSPAGFPNRHALLILLVLLLMHFREVLASVVQGRNVPGRAQRLAVRTSRRFETSTVPNETVRRGLDAAERTIIRSSSHSHSHSYKQTRSHSSTVTTHSHGGRSHSHTVSGADSRSGTESSTHHEHELSRTPPGTFGTLRSDASHTPSPTPSPTSPLPKQTPSSPAQSTSTETPIRTRPKASKAALSTAAIAGIAVTAAVLVSAILAFIAVRTRWQSRSQAISSTSIPSGGSEDSARPATSRGSSSDAPPPGSGDAAAAEIVRKLKNGLDLLLPLKVDSSTRGIGPPLQLSSLAAEDSQPGRPSAPIAPQVDDGIFATSTTTGSTIVAPELGASQCTYRAFATSTTRGSTIIAPELGAVSSTGSMPPYWSACEKGQTPEGIEALWYVAIDGEESR